MKIGMVSDNPGHLPFGEMLPCWRKFAGHAKAHGITKLCVEMHGNQVVYNVPTLPRLRMSGYDGGLFIEHEDVMLSRLEGVRRSVALPRAAAPEEQGDFAPQAIRAFGAPRDGADVAYSAAIASAPERAMR